MSIAINSIIPIPDSIGNICQNITFDFNVFSTGADTIRIDVIVPSALRNCGQNTFNQNVNNGNNIFQISNSFQFTQSVAMAQITFKLTPNNGASASMRVNIFFNNMNNLITHLESVSTFNINHSISSINVSKSAAYKVLKQQGFTFNKQAKQWEK